MRRAAVGMLDRARHVAERDAPVVQRRVAALAQPPGRLVPLAGLCARRGKRFI